MKIAVMSDIHGYSLALERVLDDIATEPGVELIIAAGDLCEGGPDPVGALTMLRDHDVRLIRGNTDRDLVEGVRTSAPATWVTEQLGDEGIAFLAELPFDFRFSPPGGRPGDDDLLVVHANPFDEDRPIAPWATDLEVRALLGDTRAGVVAFGHIHIAYQRDIDGMRLIDVSAVGNPKDEDLRSKWGLCVWDEANCAWSTHLRYVEYPLDETLAHMELSGMPKWNKVANKLQLASYREL